MQAKQTQTNSAIFNTAWQPITNQPMSNDDILGILSQATFC